ncbi:MAG: hypothetical protein Q8P22_00125 [Chloroflexota bacterium]|nr:hypothetical protein [Chloroflexota bacterium]
MLSLRHTKWLVVTLIVSIVLVLGLGAAPPDAGPPDAGPLPPGLAVKVFVHHPRGHDTGVTAASICADPSPSGCADFAIATTSGGLPIRWQDPTGGGAGIPYYVQLNYSAKTSPALTKSAALAAIDASFATWETASDAGLNYTNKGTLSRATLPRLDGKNVVGWKAVRSNAIAVTYVWYYTSTGYIAETDMVFNNNYRWAYTPPVCDADGNDACDPATYEDPTNSGVAKAMDVRNIGTHEAGHTLMLLDMYDASHANLTMYGYGDYAEMRKDTLAKGDDLGVKAIY